MRRLLDVILMLTCGLSLFLTLFFAMYFRWVDWWETYLVFNPDDCSLTIKGDESSYFGYLTFGADTTRYDVRSCQLRTLFLSQLPELTCINQVQNLPEVIEQLDVVPSGRDSIHTLRLPYFVDTNVNEEQKIYMWRAD